MARADSQVYLGYEEDVVPERNLTLLNYTTNKIGGVPDWPPVENLHFSRACPQCGLQRLLVVQCYAPLEGSVYHRTLYIFACISPNCWNQTECWACVRSQVLEEVGQDGCTAASQVAVPSADSGVEWCSGADAWGDDNGDTANGNVVDASPGPNSMHRSSDEDDESNSIEMDTVEQALGNLQVYDARNANMSPVQGAVGAAGAPNAAAELEGGDEPGLVTVDTPTAPVNDLQALLHETAELPLELRTRLQTGALQFVPRYLYVEPESAGASTADERALELLSKYRRENGDGAEAAGAAGAGGAGGDCGGDEEAYEEARPLHGDRLFHAFLTRLRANPGQILRYSRGAPPLLGAPLPAGDAAGAAPLSRCQRCGARTVCELQLLPGVAAALALCDAARQTAHLQLLSVSGADSAAMLTPQVCELQLLPGVAAALALRDAARQPAHLQLLSVSGADSAAMPTPQVCELQLLPGVAAALALRDSACQPAHLQLLSVLGADSAAMLTPQVCELQLLPGVAAALALRDAARQPAHLQLLSVLVFTCEASCWRPGDTIVREPLVFQPEVL